MNSEVAATAEEEEAEGGDEHDGLHDGEYLENDGVHDCRLEIQSFPPQRRQPPRPPQLLAHHLLQPHRLRRRFAFPHRKLSLSLCRALWFGRFAQRDRECGLRFIYILWGTKGDALDASK